MRSLADDRVLIKILFLTRYGVITLRFGWTRHTTSSCIATCFLLLVFVLGARGTSSSNSAKRFLLILCSLIYSYSKRQLGLSYGLVLGLRLGTRKGLMPAVPFGFTDRLELGLRLGTREGLRLGLPLGFLDGLVLGLRLGNRDAFELSDGLNHGSWAKGLSWAPAWCWSLKRCGQMTELCCIRC